MRCLEINKSPIKYLNYQGREKAVDSNGNYTGETIVKYTKPCMVMGHISGAKGSSQVEVFGTDINYDKTILLSVSEFKKTKINENSVFFIEKKVEYKDNVPLYDYRVVRIAETINEVLIAIEKVSK